MSLSTRELDYSKVNVDHPEYSYVRQPPQTNAGQAITGASGTELVFELPPKVYNLSKTRLRYTLKMSGIANDTTIMHADCIPEIRAIQLYTRGGLFLADIQNANKYTNATLRHETPYEKIMENDIPVHNATGTTANTHYTGYWEGLTLPNQVMTLVAANANTLTTVSNIVIPALQGANKIDNLKTPSYAICKTLASNGTAASNDLYIRRNFELGLYKDSIFSLDKDIYFGDTIYLKLILEDPGKTYYTADETASLVNPAAGTAYTLGPANVATPMLMLCQEVNPKVEQSLMSAVRSGMKMMIPYVYGNVVNSNASTNHSLIVRYNRGHGKKLKRVLWVPYTPWNAANPDQAFDHNNNALTKITTFHTIVNNARTTQFNIDCTVGDDYMIQKDRLRGSGVTSYRDYIMNFRYEEDFSYAPGHYADLLNVPVENLIDGKDLDSEVIYNVEAQGSNTAYDHHFFAVCLRELTITGSGIELI